MSRIIKSLKAQIWVETLLLLRNTIFLSSISTFAILFSIFWNGNHDLLVVFGVVIVFSISIERFSIDISNERLQGWIKLLRITPLPPGIYLIAKLIVSLLIAVVLLGIILSITLIRGEINLDALPYWISTFSLIALGSLPFSIVFFAFGYWLVPQATSTVIVLFLMLAVFTSVPLPGMPAPLQNLIPFSPFFHYKQLLVWVTSDNANVNLYPLVHFGWLVWMGSVGSALAAWAYQRESEIN